MSADVPAGDADRATRVATCLRLGAATLHEASGQHGALPGAIHVVTPGLAVAGRALPVEGPAGDNLWLHRAIYRALPGDVLVVGVGGGVEWGYWGAVMGQAARARGIAGLVIDGCVRDVDELTAAGFPVFARGISIKGTTKRVHGAGRIGHPVVIGDIVVSAGDWVVGDNDGVVAIVAADVAATIERGIARELAEREIIAALQRGARTLDLYGLPD